MTSPASKPVDAPALRVLSLGAGVQSTTVALLAALGRIEPVQHAIFADTGWEPRAVYEHLERLRDYLAGTSIQLHVVSGGNVREIRPLGEGGAMDVPFHVKFADGGGGISRRQCTSKLKIQPIRRKVRELMAEAGTKRAVQVFGISVDEYQRMRRPDVKYLTHEYPLVDMRWSRHDCQRFLAEHWPQPVARSACIGCPYRNNRDWRDLKQSSPAEFEDAVAWEKELQAHGVAMKGKPDAVPYLHYSRRPLETIDLSTPEDHGQLALDWGDECAGMCGV